MMMVVTMSSTWVCRKLAFLQRLQIKFNGRVINIELVFQHLTHFRDQVDGMFLFDRHDMKGDQSILPGQGPCMHVKENVKELTDLVVNMSIRHSVVNAFICICHSFLTVSDHDMYTCA